MNASLAGTIHSETTTQLMTEHFAPLDVVAAARTDVTVLFTGTPLKAEALARQIHDSSGWRHGTFVVVDCTQAEPVVEAVLSRLVLPGPAAAADVSPSLRLSQDGSIFLREVNALPPSAQAWLVDWLEHLRRPGKRMLHQRLMASTSEPLLPRVADGTFDDRLYYRLNVIHVVLPVNDDIQVQD